MDSSSDHCTVLVHTDSSTSLPNVQTLKRTLEKGNDKEKINAMEAILTMILNGGLLLPLVLAD